MKPKDTYSSLIETVRGVFELTIQLLLPTDIGHIVISLKNTLVNSEEMYIRVWNSVLLFVGNIEDLTKHCHINDISSHVGYVEFHYFT